MDIDSKLVTIIRKKFDIIRIDGELYAHIPKDIWDKHIADSKLSLSDAQVSTSQVRNNKMTDHKYTIFTDGGCSDNGGKNPVASYAYVIFSDGKEIHRESGLVVQGVHGDEKPSNNRGELFAILYALEYADKYNLSNVTLYSDSKISVNTINEWYNTWITKGIVNKKANAKLITAVMNIYGRLKNITVLHCRASHGHEPDESDPSYMIWYGNDICDKMCSQRLVS
jgi:ribonuclease HI